MIKANNLCFSRQGKSILNSVSLTLEQSETLGVIGPNGCGKTTLLRLLFGAEQVDRGSITLNGHPLKGMNRKHIARNIAYMPQERPVDFGQTVMDLVMLGRLCHHGLLSVRNEDDTNHAKQALEKVGLTHLQDRKISNLSGGEIQRVLIARTLCQGADVIFLDEPTNHLDISYQIEILDLITRLNCSSILVLHDINLASRYCDRIMLLNNGCIHAIGTPQQVLTEQNLSHVYQIQMTCMQDTRDRLHVVVN